MSVRQFWTVFHWIAFVHAVLRGPKYFAGYEIRRQARRASYRATRRMK